MDRLKLKWKVFAFLLGFCALLLAMQWLFQNVFLYDMYKFTRTREIRSAISYVEENINNPDLFAVFEELQKEKEIFVTRTAEFVPPQEAVPMQERVQGQMPPDDKRIHGRMPQETITEQRTFLLADGSELSLTFHAMISPVDATVSTLQLQLYIVTAVMIVMSVLLAVIISRRVSKPLEDLNNSAKSLAQGDYSATFNGKGFLEIKELSDTLNTTAAELSKTEGLRRELMANVSHDLRTPLSLIYSYSEMMRDFPDEITPQQTEVIMEETKRLTSLVNDILDNSKLENGISALHCTTFNLTASLRAITERTAELLKQNGYAIHMDYDDECFVYADETKITQAFYNMLINAVNYSGDDKRIDIRQSAGDGKVKIEIIDYGMGIAAEDLPYIWDRYYKLDKNHKRAIVGSGLGLSIVRKILELHQAEYGVTSELGKGSTFRFVLDRAETPAAPVTAQ